MRTFPLFCLCFLFAAAVPAATPTVLSWSKWLNDPAHYDNNTSGRLTRSFDKQEQAIRFDVEFTPGTDFWCYPRCYFPKGKTLQGVEKLRFEIKALPVSESGYKVCFVMFEDGLPMVSYPAPTTQWQKVEINIADWVKSPAAVNSLRIGMNPLGDKLTYFIRNIELVGIPVDVSPAAIDAAEAITAAAPAALFTTAEPLQFTTTMRHDRLQWTLRNWDNRLLCTGSWPDGGKTPLRLASLPTGYYALELTAGGEQLNGKRTFAVVADPEKRRRNQTKFFALDTAQSWIAQADPGNPRHSGDGFELTSETAYRVGAGAVRDRFGWAQCEPKAGEFRWEQYVRNIDLLHARGIAVTDLFHDAPDFYKGKLPLLPGKLDAVYRFSQKLARTFHGRVTAWEFWNEPDIGFTQEGAWDYAAALKAAYLGFKAGDPTLPVAIGGFSQLPLRPYVQLILDNGTADYMDIFNVHLYDSLGEFTSQIREIQKFQQVNNISSRPLWITENGCRIEGSGRAASFMEQYKAHDVDQELIVAEFLPKSMILLQSLGVDRDYFFVLPPFSENYGSKDWGLLRRDYTAKPALAAFSTLTELLSSACYLGRIDLGNRDVNGFLYQLPDETQTIVYWTGSELDKDRTDPSFRITSALEQPIQLTVADGLYQGREFLGTPFPVKVDQGKLCLTAVRYPAYVTGLRGLRPTLPFRPIPRSGAPAETTCDRTVVIRADLGPEFRLASDKTHTELTHPPGKVTCELYNFSAEKKSGTLRVSGGKAANLPSVVELSAWGKATVEFEFSPAFASGVSRVELRVEGSFNGRKTTPLVIPVLDPEQMMKEAKKVLLSGMQDPANWRKNASGKLDISYDRAEKALRFQVQFPPLADRWVYPEYPLQLPQESLAGALGVSFEIKCNVPKINTSLLMTVMDLSQERGKSFYLPYEKPTAEWQERVVLFPAELFDPSLIKQLRIGMNPETAEAVFWIRNIRVLYDN